MQPIRDNARVLAAAMVGTTVEFYDFFIYATAAALVFGPLFFPSESATAQSLLAFMSFGVAFIARPFGAIAFGHFGDRIGRKSTLVLSMMLMGLSTVLIAFLPTYAMVGWVAPVLLCIMRFGQGFGLGGEWGGAALLAVENAPKGWEARFGAAPQIGIPTGLFIANAVFLALGGLLSEEQFMSWGWRVPFLLSAVLVALGLYVRNRIGETPAFKAALAKGIPERVPLASLLAHHFPALLAGLSGAIVAFATFYLATAWALAETTGPQGHPRETMLAWQMLANLTMAAGIVTAVIVADRSSSVRALDLGVFGVIAMGIVFGPALGSGSATLAGLAIVTTMFFMGMTNGPFASFSSSLFPVRLRYSGTSLAFNMGGLIGGAATPLAATWISAQGAVRWVGAIMVVAGLLTFLGIRIAKPADPHG
jgi:predicted MFS family arabinose efflux permease